MTKVRNSPSGKEIEFLGGVLPLKNLTYVEPDTTVAVSDGSIGAPYKTIQAALDAGKFLIYFVAAPGVLTPEVAVVPSGTVSFIINAPNPCFLAGLTVPDGCQAVIRGVTITTQLTAGNGAFVNTDSAIGKAVFGDGSILVTSKGGNEYTFGTGCHFLANGPGGTAVDGGVAILQINLVTMGAGGLFQASDAFFATGSVINADIVRLLECESVSTITALFLGLESCLMNGGVCTADNFELVNTKAQLAASFVVPATPGTFLLDGYSNYWIKTNAISISNPAAKLVTEDLAP